MPAGATTWPCLPSHGTRAIRCADGGLDDVVGVAMPSAAASLTQHQANSLA